MSQMMSFSLWFVQQLPAFLMAEPVCYFVGFAFLFVIVTLISRIIHLSR